MFKKTPMNTRAGDKFHKGKTLFNFGTGNNEFSQKIDDIKWSFKEIQDQNINIKDLKIGSVKEMPDFEIERVKEMPDFEIGKIYVDSYSKCRVKCVGHIEEFEGRNKPMALFQVVSGSVKLPEGQGGFAEENGFIVLPRTMWVACAWKVEPEKVEMSLKINSYKGWIVHYYFRTKEKSDENLSYFEYNSAIFHSDMAKDKFIKMAGIDVISVDSCQLSISEIVGSNHDKRLE